MPKRKRGGDQGLRAPLRSPGRPGAAKREQRRKFWQAIAEGRASEDAALDCGVSSAVGTRWFREAGGMAPTHLAPSARPPSGRYLSFCEREEIALLKVQGLGVREIARRIGRAGSTISRELRRNAATRGGGMEYRATTAQWHAERAALRPRRRSSPRTRPCAATWRIVWRGGSLIPKAGPSRSPGRHGESAAMDPGRRADGRGPGARSRSRPGSKSTSPRTTRCASPTRPSTSLSSSRAEARCGASCAHVYGPVERSGSPEPASGAEASPSSRPTS